MARDIAANPDGMQQDAFVGYETAIDSAGRRYHGAVEASRQKKPPRGEIDETVRTVTTDGGVQVLGIFGILGAVTRGDSGQVNTAGKLFEVLEQSNIEAAGDWTGNTRS